MLSIIIVNFKNPPLLRLCLKSLIATTKTLSKEIIVVDSASTSETRNVVTEEFPGVTLVACKENVGYTLGVNKGIQAARGEYMLILNPDIIPLENSIGNLLEFAKKNPWAGLIGPRLLNFDGTPQKSCFRFYKPTTIVYRRTFLGHFPWAKKELSRFLMEDKDMEHPLTVDWLMGSALLVSRKAIEKVGIMDESLFLYMSEVDWARRFWENGYSIYYVPASLMYHYHQRDSRAGFGLFDIFIRKESRWHLIDAYRYFRKYGIKSISYVDN